jgi:hypothetical protein
MSSFIYLNDYMIKRLTSTQLEEILRRIRVLGFKVLQFQKGVKTKLRFLKRLGCLLLALGELRVKFV